MPALPLYSTVVQPFTSVSLENLLTSFLHFHIHSTSPCSEPHRDPDAPATLEDANFLATWAQGTPPYHGILILEEVFPSGFGEQLPRAVEVVWGHKLKQAVLPERRGGKGSRSQASHQ